MILTLLALISLVIWLGLILAHGQFWTAGVHDDRHPAPEPAQWPDVVAVVPARDEAEVIARSVASLAAQDYPGDFRVIVVDDGSSDGTAELARQAGGSRVQVLAGAPLPAGWTGKIWAQSHGIAAAGTPRYLWLTDADITHAPDTLRSLVARAEAGGLVLVSLMALLRCRSAAERWLVPAFVLFFQMLYPFARVNRPGATAAAAGGCMLARRDALERAGGIAAIRTALIDDCAMGGLLKAQGPIWLGLTRRSVSIRIYDTWGSVLAMIERSAYAQLGYNPLALAGTLLGLLLVFIVPPFAALAGHGMTRWAGLAAWALMTLSHIPMLRFYRLSALRGPLLPLIGLAYAGATLASGWNHARGRGGMWKGRVQAAAGSVAAGKASGEQA